MLPDLSSLLGRRQELVWQQVHWPPQLPVERAVAVLRQLATDRFATGLVLEAEGRNGAVVYRLGAPAPAIRRVQQVLTALLPETAMTPSPRPKLPAAWRITLSNSHRLLETADPERVTRALLAALTAAGKDEQIVVQWLLGRARAPRAVGPSETAPATNDFWRALTVGQAALDPGQRRALELKRGDHAFSCIGRVGIRAATPARTRALAVGVLAALRTAEGPGVGVRLVKESAESFNNVSTPWRWPSVLNVAELVGLLGWPLGDEALPGVPRDQNRKLRPDKRLRTHRRVVGQADIPGDDRLIGLSIDDARQHLHVIGPTGTGKSTLLGNLIVQDIAAGRGGSNPFPLTPCC